MNSSHDAEQSQPRREQSDINGFKVYTLWNGFLRASFVPELGARLISLRRSTSDREWMWFPGNTLRLFSSPPGADFATSPLVGLDECLPTIAPCTWQDRQLPDHGEAWGDPWTVDVNDWTHCRLTTRLRLRVSPFLFERTVRLNDDSIQFTYRLTNLSHHPEHYLWAMHPLIRFLPGDRLILPPSSENLLPDRSWLCDLDSVVANGACTKIFLAPIKDGWVIIDNGPSGEQLELTWNPEQNHTLGLWLTRQGWNGHSHLAVEPTNGQPDSLAEAAAHRQCGEIGASQTVSWEVQMHVRLRPPGQKPDPTR